MKPYVVIVHTCSPGERYTTWTDANNKAHAISKVLRRPAFAVLDIYNVHVYERNA